jgi:hypothetical protein
VPATAPAWYRPLVRDEPVLCDPPHPPIHIGDPKIIELSFEPLPTGTIHTIGAILARHDHIRLAHRLTLKQRMILEEVDRERERIPVPTRTVEEHHDHLVLVVEPVVPRLHLEHQAVGAEVVPIRRTLVIVPLVPGL